MPKLNWKNFEAKFDGKEQDIFQFLSYLLFTKEFNQPNGIPAYKNQTGIETEPIFVNGKWIGFQAKFYKTKISANNKEIKEGIEKAKIKNPKLNKIYFYLNQEITEHPSPTEKKPRYLKDIENFAHSLKVEIDWRFPSHFEIQLEKRENRYLEKRYFSNDPEFLFDEVVFQNYLGAIQSFSQRTPYLALYEIFGGKTITLDDIYVPVALQISNSKPLEENIERAEELDSSISNEVDKQTTSGIREANAIAEVFKLLGNQKTKKHILFQSGAGGGKSTILHRIAKDAWANPNALGLETRHLPLIVRLRTLAEVKVTPIEEKIAQSIYEGGDIFTARKLPDNFLSEWSEEVNAPWLIMLDGLDEVVSAKRTEVIKWIEELLKLLQNSSHKIILTSRPLEDKQYQAFNDSFLICNLLTFDQNQRQEFAKRWFPEKGDDFIEKIKLLTQPISVFRETILITPLLLTIAALVYQSKGDLTETSLNELYESFIKILFKEAEKRGLREELGAELFSIAESALDRLALETTDNPEKNSFSELTQVCVGFIQESLGFSAFRAKSEGEKLCDVLTRRSGVLYREGNICLWGHATIREYLSARHLLFQLEYQNSNLQTVLGNRILDAKNYEMLLAFSRNYPQRYELIKWMCHWVKETYSSTVVNLVYDIWEESEQSIRHDLEENIILALGCSFGDRQGGYNLEREAKQILIEMGSKAVQPLLNLLAEFNDLSIQLVPKGIKSEDQSDQVQDQIYSVYGIRTNIIKILGKIGDERAIEPLIDLIPDKNQSFRKHYDIARTTEKALSCIGESVITPLLTKINNKKLPVEWRCNYLRALCVVGTRTKEVSNTIQDLLIEGLNSKDEKLLVSTISTAQILRDKSQSDLITKALQYNAPNVVGRAANYFSILPNKSANSLLINVFSRFTEIPDNESWELRDAVENLCKAIFINGDEKSKDIVLIFLQKILREHGILYSYQALDILIQSHLPQIPQILVKELAWQLKQEKPDRIVDTLLREIAKLWKTGDLNQLTSAALDEFNQNQREESFVEKLINLINEKPEIIDGQEYPLSAIIDRDKLVKTFVNCRIRNFAIIIGELLEEEHYGRNIELCQILWIAGDTSAEPYLIEKLQQLENKRRPNEESSTEEYYVLRALATCGTQKGAEVVLQFILDYPRLSIYLPDEILRPLIRRKIIDTDIISQMAVDRTGTHEYVRNFCLQTLAGIDVPKFTHIFLDALANESDEQTQGFAIHALEWTSPKFKKEVISQIENLLKNTNSTSITTRAGKTLVRLKSKKSLSKIEQAITKFGGGEKMSDLLRAVARFRSPSTFALLPKIPQNAFRYPHTDRNIILALGEFYQTEKKAEEIIKNSFEVFLHGLDSGKQSFAVPVLAENEPNYLLRKAIELFNKENLEQSSKIKIIRLSPKIVEKENLNDSDFIKLYGSFLCDVDLTVRETAAENISLLPKQIRRKIYYYLQNLKSQWSQGCLVYSMAFCDGSIEEIENYRFHSSKIVRYFADKASLKYKNRVELEKVLQIFQFSENAAERVSAYYSLIEQAGNNELKYLFQNINYESKEYSFLRSIEAKIDRRLEKEIKDREKEENEKFCLKQLSK